MTDITNLTNDELVDAIGRHEDGFVMWVIAFDAREQRGATTAADRARAKAAQHAAILTELRHMQREREASETFTEGE